MLNEMCCVYTALHTVCVFKRIYFIVGTRQSLKQPACRIYTIYVGWQCKRRITSMWAVYGLNFILTIHTSYKHTHTHTQTLAIMMMTMMMTMIQQSRKTHPLRWYFITYSLTEQAEHSTFTLYYYIIYRHIFACQHLLSI